MYLYNKYFKKDNVLMLEETNNIEINIQEKNKNLEIDIQEEKIEDNIHSKEDYFKIYDNIKKGILSPDDLILSDLIKIMVLMKEEENILKEKTKRK